MGPGVEEVLVMVGVGEDWVVDLVMEHQEVGVVLGRLLVIIQVDTEVSHHLWVEAQGVWPLAKKTIPKVLTASVVIPVGGLRPLVGTEVKGVVRMVLAVVEQAASSPEDPPRVVGAEGLVGEEGDILTAKSQHQLGAQVTEGRRQQDTEP
jgi:hypothetical protein